MTEVAGPKPFRWRALAAVFALTVVAGGAQALAPAPAGAFQPECLNWWECDSAPTGDSDSWKNIGWAAERGDSVKPTAESRALTPPPPTRSPFGPGAGDGRQPTSPSGSRPLVERAKLKIRRVECRRLREKIRDRIGDLYGGDSSFDEVVNSGDQKLDRLQAAWRDDGCEDVKQ